MGTQTAVHTPAFRNCVFQNLTFLNHLKINITITSFCNLKVLKSAAKNRKKNENENRSTYEKTMPQIYFTFSHFEKHCFWRMMYGA